MNRREALKILGVLPLASYGGRLFSAPKQRKFLLVFLRGAYDAASLLVPISSEFYYQSRPNIAIPKPRSDIANADIKSALALNDDWGLHPALKESLYPLYKNGQLAFIPFSGTNDLSRSHFETQDSIELSLPSVSYHQERSGFMNRLAASMNGTSAISFTDQLPLVFQGNFNIPNIALRQIAKAGGDARPSQIITQMYQGSRLSQPVQDGYALRSEVMKDIGDEMVAANRNAISSKNFAIEARRIAKLMRQKYSLGFVDVGGWDTHVGQGGSTGILANRLDDLGQGLAAYADEMAEDWADTIVVVISEFGRTLRENGNRGTDHGHGTTYWVLGGNIKGGSIVGEQIEVNQANLFQNRDFPVLNEYRSILGGILAKHYDLSSAQMSTIFPNSHMVSLGLN